MGEIDSFAARHFTSGLRPGEALELLGIGMLTGRDNRTYALLGLTNQRLLLAESPADAWANAPKAEVNGTTSFELAELAQVRARVGSDIHGAIKWLDLVRPQGELTIQLRPAHKQFGNVWNFGGFDGHIEFHDLVPDFLARHVAAGTMRTPQGALAAMGELRNVRAHRANAAAQQAQVMAQTAAVHAARASIKWPYGMMVVPILVMLLGIFIVLRGANDVSHAEEMPRYIAKDRMTKYSLYSDPKVAASALQAAARSREAGQERMMHGGLVAGVGVLGAVGLLVLGISLNKKKRERLATGTPALA